MMFVKLLSRKGGDVMQNVLYPLNKVKEENNPLQ